jgi:hypothetical protein
LTDLRTDDPQLPVLLLLTFGLFLGFAQPQAAWRWALVLGLWIPFLGWIARAARVTNSQFSDVLFFVALARVDWRSRSARPPFHVQGRRSELRGCLRERRWGSFRRGWRATKFGASWHWRRSSGRACELASERTPALTVCTLVCPKHSWGTA